MVATPSPSALRAAFERRLEWTYQRVVRLRALADRMADVVADADTKLALLQPHITIDDETSPMTSLARRLAMESAHCDVAWTIVACSFEARMLPHLEALGGPQARQGLSLELYAVLAGLDDTSVNRLVRWFHPGNPVLALGLLVASAHSSPAARTYVASDRFADYLCGEDSRIGPLRIVAPDRPLLHDARQASCMAAIANVVGSNRDPVIVIEGPNGSGRATACAHAANKPIIVLDCARIDPARIADALIALKRETSLRPALPLLANLDHAISNERRELRGVIADFIDTTDGPVLVTVTVAGTDAATSRPIVRFRWEVADTEIRRRQWIAAAQSTGLRVSGELSELAFRYRVGPAAITRAVESVRVLSPSDAVVDDGALAVGLRHNIAERLGGLAERVEVRQNWDDLVLADDTLAPVRALVGRLRDAHQVLDRWAYREKIARGAGVAALFSGPPGTGKTMVAGIIARELDLELYQVDLSKVVSKWVGETEKNLARVFDAAEEGHALLLFDEADALFGQRSSDIKGANDRYANLEVNYLLQRVEAFGGITILTTNLETAIDEALKRRLSAHVVFAKPDDDERALLWERQTKTAAAPLAGDLDYEELSRHFPHMSGANIRNAAISAAFLAAAERAPRITQDHLVQAARAEYRSMGHVLSDALGSRSQLRSL